MKKVLLAAMIALTGISFVSCSSSESNADKEYRQEQVYQNAIIGKWKVVAEKSSGNLYNLLYRLEGDFYITFSNNGSVTTQGSAKTHGYYEGGSEFVTEDVEDYLGVAKWTLSYSEATGAHVSLYKTQTATPSYHDINFNTDGTIWIWFSGMSNRYYILKKIE